MMFDDDQLEVATEKLKAISHSIRLKILCFLMDGEKNVGEIENEFGSTISNISQHLTVLRKASIITRKKEANFMFYSLKNDNIENLMESIKSNLC